jgi:hypothetical protein
MGRAELVVTLYRAVEGGHEAVALRLYLTAGTDQVLVPRAVIDLVAGSPV